MKAQLSSMMEVCRFALVFGVFFFGAAASAQPLGGKCQLIGEIYGIPPGSRDIIVELNSRGRSEPPARTFANESGAFEFHNLEAGQYTLEVKSWRGDLLMSVQVAVHGVDGPVRINLPANRFGRPASGTVSVARLRRDPSGESVRQYQEAGRMFLLGDRKRGMKHLLKSLDRDPEFAEARVALGAAKAEEGSWDLAMAEFRQALTAEPAMARAAELVATAAIQLGHYDEAETVSRQLTRRYPNNLMARHLLGLSLVLQGKPGEEALACFERASKEVPEASQAYAKLSEYLAQNRATEK